MWFYIAVLEGLVAVQPVRTDTVSIYEEDVCGRNSDAIERKDGRKSFCSTKQGKYTYRTEARAEAAEASWKPSAWVMSL
jgi:hypothetical protein